jgi:hypothetical protein
MAYADDSLPVTPRKLMLMAMLPGSLSAALPGALPALPDPIHPLQRRIMANERELARLRGEIDELVALVARELRPQGEHEIKRQIEREIELRLKAPAPKTSLKTWLFTQGVVDFPRRLPGEQVWSRRGECWCRRLAREAERAGFPRASASTIKTYLHRGNGGRT